MYKNIHTHIHRSVPFDQCHYNHVIRPCHLRFSSPTINAHICLAFEKALCFHKNSYLLLFTQVFISQSYFSTEFSTAKGLANQGGLQK